MAKNKEAESKLKDGIDSDNFITIYCHFIYKFIGRKLIKRPKFSKFFYESIYNKKYEGILKKANLKLLPEEYFMGIYITLVTTLATVVLLTIAFLIAGSALSVIAFFGGVGCEKCGVSVATNPADTSASGDCSWINATEKQAACSHLLAWRCQDKRAYPVNGARRFRQWYPRGR